MHLELRDKFKSFGGWVEFYEHPSQSCPQTMRFSVYRPEQAKREKLPVLYWLSGLTCTEENFMIKSGVQALAARYGFLIVAPDTSPRGAGIEGEDDSWDFGTGAGFYLDATQPKWSSYYHMYSYVTKELYHLVNETFPTRPEHSSIFGHSMGGHGALTIAFKNPDQYRSVSAFAPICAPTQCPWGQKAFRHYLGENPQDWESYDAHLLAARTDYDRPILVDQGDADQFLETQLFPHYLKKACADSGLHLELRMQPGYDHSYYFIASFLHDHFEFHARHLVE